jgi:hypothetical protein
MPSLVRRSLAILSLLALPITLIVLSGGAASAARTTSTAKATSHSHVKKSSSLGTFTPTFTGPAATGCNSPGCDLLTGPFPSASTAGLSAKSPGVAAGAADAKQLAATAAAVDTHHAMPSPNGRVASASSGTSAGVRAGVNAGADSVTPAPTVSCKPRGPGCDTISTSAGGAVTAKGLNAVDSGTLSTNPLGDIEPADQGLCAGHGYVVETNNIGEVLIFNQHLNRLSSPIPLDTLMGLTGLGYSSGGDPSCLYDYSNGGHWFFTEIVSKTSEANGGTFAGCFAAAANTCTEGIAVTKGSNPFGPYNVYFVNANYNPNEPGNPYLLNDFAKISSTRDAFLLFYDEFPLNLATAPGFGGGFFNGAQELAFDKNALEEGLPVVKSNGKPNPKFNVAIENMGLLPTPAGTCASDNVYHEGGIACWFTVIPAQAPDPSQFDNSYGGSGFMLASTNFYGFAGGLPTAGANQIAVWAWTGLRGLNSSNCNKCSKIQFSGQIFNNLQLYNNPSNAVGVGILSAQKAGPIPLGDECGAAGLSTGTPPPASCPENGLNTNDDGFFQVSQAQNQLWGAVDTAINQTFKSKTEQHAGAAYWVIGTRSFDKWGFFTLTSQGYVSAKHEDLAFPAMAAEGFRWQDGGNGGAIMDFTLSGNGGPTGADNGGFFPSTAFVRLSSWSGGGLGPIHVSALGKSPQDGFSEYQGYPGATRPRWGDYSWAIFVPWSGGKIDFATNYIQYKNCTGSAFTLTLATCGGTRDGFANWGTSVNYVVP